MPQLKSWSAPALLSRSISPGSIVPAGVELNLTCAAITASIVALERLYSIIAPCASWRGDIAPLKIQSVARDTLPCWTSDAVVPLTLISYHRTTDGGVESAPSSTVWLVPMPVAGVPLAGLPTQASEEPSNERVLSS